MDGCEAQRRWESDLACERREGFGVRGLERTVREQGPLTWERIRICTEEAARAVGRPVGRYDTMHLPPMDTLTEDVREAAAEELSRELISLARHTLGHAPASVLVVGLGNAAMTADAVGPLTADKIHPTRHIRRFDDGMFHALDCAEIAVVRPGVSADSGLDAAETVIGLCERLGPELVIVFDALAARSTERLGRTVQAADTGVCPGSGVGNHRTPLDREVLGVPVLSVGVPTVTDSRIFFEEEARRLGLPEGEAPEGGGMFVSPRGIDDIVKTASDILSEAVNRAFGISLG